MASKPTPFTQYLLRNMVAHGACASAMTFIRESNPTHMAHLIRRCARYRHTQYELIYFVRWLLDPSGQLEVERDRDGFVSAVDDGMIAKLRDRVKLMQYGTSPGAKFLSIITQDWNSQGGSNSDPRPEGFIKTMTAAWDALGRRVPWPVPRARWLPMQARKDRARAASPSSIRSRAVSPAARAAGQSA